MDPKTRLVLKRIARDILELVGEAEQNEPLSAPENCGTVRYLTQAPFGIVVTDKGVWELDENRRWVSVPAYEAPRIGS